MRHGTSAGAPLRRASTLRSPWVAVASSARSSQHPVSLEAMESAPEAGQPAEGSFGDLPPALLGRVLPMTGTTREIG